MQKRTVSRLVDSSTTLVVCNRQSTKLQGGERTRGCRRQGQGYGRPSSYLARAVTMLRVTGCDIHESGFRFVRAKLRCVISSPGSTRYLLGRACAR